MALVDALATMVRFLLLRGQAHDMKGVARLIQDVSFAALPADKAFMATRYDKTETSYAANRYLRAMLVAQ